MNLPHAVPNSVKNDLARLVESEELGENYFAAAARLSSAESSKRAWEALRDLEAKTNVAVREFIARSAVAIAPTNAIARIAGTVGGAGAVLIPDELRWRLLKRGTDRYLPAFVRLASFYDGTPEQAFFDYVLRHELAIISFADSSIRGEPAALDPVLRLLDHQLPSS